MLLSTGYELATFDTRLRALDPSQRELLCLDVNTTMLVPGAVDSVYGHAHIIFWCTVGLAIGYWAIVGIARLVAAWGRGSSMGGSGILARIEGAGFILASALSGERFASSPALMRFCKSIYPLSWLRKTGVDETNVWSWSQISAPAPLLRCESTSRTSLRMPATYRLRPILPGGTV